MKVTFYTLGCKVNQYETQSIREAFEADGFEVVGNSEAADVMLVNSCTVTTVSDQKTRNHIRRFKRNNPNAVVVLTGCYVTAFPQKANQLPEVDVVVGANSKNQILQLTKQCLANRQKISLIKESPLHEQIEPMSIHSFEGKTRAFVKIEDGCNQFCSYCIIPYARGRVRSKHPDQITAELQDLAAAGYKEVVLVGINLSSYGTDMGYRLIDAIHAACAVCGIQRVRLGSIEPELLTPEDIRQMAKQPKFCPQFHLALQSGCDKILSAMRRRYTTAEYKAICDQIYASFENPSITTDIIVGFPGETEQDFEETLTYAKKIGFARIHAFPFSRREGTTAYKMPNQIDKAKKEQRNRQLIAISDQCKKSFLQKQVGTTASVLVETPGKDGIMRGYTKNYTEVLLPNCTAKTNDIVTVRLTDIAPNQEGCVGEII